MSRPISGARDSILNKHELFIRLCVNALNLKWHDSSLIRTISVYRTQLGIHLMWVIRRIMWLAFYSRNNEQLNRLETACDIRRVPQFVSRLVLWVGVPMSLQRASTLKFISG